MIQVRYALLLTVWLFSLPVGANDNKNQAAIASAHPLATEAGFEILKQGGNAFDAAIAVSAALAVVEPTGSGLGGGGFWLLHQADSGQQIMLDGRETAPAAAHRDMYLNSNQEVEKASSLDGPLAAAIPGVPAALDHLSQKYGRLPLSQSLAPAIRYAEKGFKISTHYQQMAMFRLNALKKSPAASQLFLLNNAVPPLSHIIKQTDLANTLRQLAHHGRAGFYQGDVAQKLVTGVTQAGGIWTLDDLRHYHVKERPVVMGHYRDYQISSAALPSSGGIVLSLILNQLEQFDLASYSTAQQRHLIIEAMRRAYFDRSRYLGDSDFVQIPPKLTTKGYANKLADTIDLQHASSSAKLSSPVVSKGEDTTHFSIIDQEGNRVAATLSINYPFGSAFVAPGTGVLLNDEMDDFSAKVGTANVYGLVGNEANAIAPRKRPLSSMTPTFIENDQHLMVIGTPGGSRIITMVLLAILDFIEGQSASDIVSAPRFHHQYLPDEVQLERDGFSQEEQLALQNFGHQLKILTRQYGNMQLITYNKKTQEFDVASDPRGEGMADIRCIKAATQTRLLSGSN